MCATECVAVWRQHFGSKVGTSPEQIDQSDLHRVVKVKVHWCFKRAAGHEERLDSVLRKQLGTLETTRVGVADHEHSGMFVTQDSVTKATDKLSLIFHLGQRMPLGQQACDYLIEWTLQLDSHVELSQLRQDEAVNPGPLLCR